MTDKEKKMDAIEALLTRKSATKLVEPAPPPEAIETALRAAVRAPDHGKLRPWRFILVSGEGRHRLGRIMAECLRARAPDVPEVMVQKERQKPLRAPLTIAVLASVEPEHPKIPEIEQVLSAAVAAQNIMLAFHAMGFGCMWRTGEMAYDPRLKAALGLRECDHIVALLYVGTTDLMAAADNRPDPKDFLTIWDSG